MSWWMLQMLTWSCHPSLHGSSLSLDLVLWWECLTMKIQEQLNLLIYWATKEKKLFSKFLLHLTKKAVAQFLPLTSKQLMLVNFTPRLSKANGLKMKPFLISYQTLLTKTMTVKSIGTNGLLTTQMWARKYGIGTTSFLSWIKHGESE